MPATRFYDSTTDTYLLGGQQDTNTLDQLLADYSGIDNKSLDGIRLAIGLAGGCGNGPCSESLAVDSAEITPEPGTIALMFAGFGALAALRRRTSKSVVD
jgi:hypothetical protein